MQTMTNSNPITGILVPCSSSREEELEADPSIYIRVEGSGNVLSYEWYAIGWKNSETTAELFEFIHPVFPTPPKHEARSSCGVVGSTIYVLGGADVGFTIEEQIPGAPFGYWISPPLKNDVYYIDTRNPTAGWKKGLPMLKPRAWAHPATTADGKMYVFGNSEKRHNEEDGDAFLMGEVFDGNCWRPLSVVPPSIVGLCHVSGHAVLDDHNRNSKMILLHGQDNPGLYAYDIESDSWNIYCESALGRYGMRSSAFLDGVLYCMDTYVYPGKMFAVDVSNPETKPQQVLGFDEYSIPQKPLYGGATPKGFLLSLGNSKLAVVWGGMYIADGVDVLEKTAVCCSKFKISKCRNDATGKYTFQAELLSLSHYCGMGYSVSDVVAVFPSEKTKTKEDPSEKTKTKEDASEDGNTT